MTSGDMAKRVRALRDGLGLTAKDFSARLGEKEWKIRDIERGKQKIDGNYLSCLQVNLGVSPTWVVSGVGSMFLAREGDQLENRPDKVESILHKDAVFDVSGHEIDLEEFVFVPRYRVQASAGGGRLLSEEDYMHSMAFRRYWVTKYLGADPANLAIISVDGDSMDPVLKDRDVIMLDTSRRDANHEGIYVIRLDDMLMVKQLQRLPGWKLRVSSANPAYASFDVDLSNAEEGVAVIGKVVWFGRQT
ncbi:helix-turn-helix domain-containing protein [Craterilacuibacter sinensis]|uniref:helix-turn-helix domain-containing protein n=1 Tax=Craterilacuibacter sinensis TaxID=2686017 RepID=UPI0013708B69|nr:helix-turn-helix transcriptional regulator [Craterilacuibacter sinensis]